MAQIDKPSCYGNKKKTGVKQSKKLSTNVDLTPMVDLGFLLITFFIFNTTVSQQTAIKMFLPADTQDSSLVKASGALTLLLGENKFSYYEGKLQADGSNLHTTPYNEIRNLIINKKKYTAPKDFVIVIKPQKESIYRNTVDALDEMTINGVKHYAVVDISRGEELILHNSYY